MLDLQEVCYAYDGDTTAAVDGVSLSVAPGRLICLLGANGSGKSSLARLACGDLVPDAGQVVVDGQILAHDQGGSLVALVGQDPREWLVCPRVEDEVAFGPRCRLLEAGEVAGRVDEALSACGISHLRQRDTRTLSGGQQQLVALASALAMRPRYLLLDEPTAHLDHEAREMLHTVLDGLLVQGMGILLITHDVREVAYAHEVAVMAEGRLVWQGSATSWNDAHAGDLLAAGGQVAPLSLDCLRAPEEHQPLVIDGLGISYGQGRIFDSLTLRVNPGELVLLCGRSGSGKSSLAHAAAGVLKPAEGKILLGENLVVPGQVGLSFQRAEDQLFAATVWDDVAYGPRNAGYDGQEVTRRTEAALAALGVPEDLWHRPGHELSGGMRRRVTLAALVAQAPRAYVLDEPTAALDSQGRRLLHDLVAQVLAAGYPVLLVTHDPEEWEDLAARCIDLGEANPSQSSKDERNAPAPAHRPSFLFDLDPMVRGLALLAFTLALFACKSPLGAALGIAVTLGVALLARISPRRLGRTLLPITPFLLAVIAGNALRLDGSGMAGAGWFSPAGALQGLWAATRVVLLVCLVASLAVGINEGDMVRTVASLLTPLARNGVNIADASMTVSVTFCLIPQAFEEFRRIELAQRSRGARLDEGGMIQRLRRWAAVMVPLVTVVFDRADALAHAMALRGYRGEMTPSRQRMRPSDWLAATAAIALAAAIALL